MISNVIIVVAAPFGERDFKRYGIEVIRQNGMNVSVWNVLPVVYPDLYRSITLPDPIENKGLVIEIHTKEQFAEEIYRNRSESVIYLTTYFNPATLFMYRAISKYKIPYCVTGMNAVPNFSNEYAATFSDRLRKITFRKIFFKIISKLPFNIQKLSYASMVTLIAEKASYQRPEVVSTTRVVYTHSSDYDNFMETNRLDENYPKTIIYLDNYLPYHSDGLYIGEKAPVTASTYHGMLNLFFEKLTETTGMEVIIAAHPKADYTGDNNPFSGKKVVRGKTAALVKNAEMVVLNFSTSMNYAMLYYKPVVFFTTNELEEIALYRKHIAGLADMFGKKIYNIDQVPVAIDQNDLYKVDHDRYSDYINDYIKKKGSPEKHSWQIKCDAFKTL